MENVAKHSDFIGDLPFLQPRDEYKLLKSMIETHKTLTLSWKFCHLNKCVETSD